MRPHVFSLLADLNPVLVDVGASAGPPESWSPIAQFSTYVGFDPDSRDFGDLPRGGFRRSVMVNQAVTHAPAGGEVVFNLTRAPHCSSVLEPDFAVLDDFLFREMFQVERQAAAPATSLGAVVERLGVKGIDWLKLDSQGTDLRLFASLGDELRAGLLAVDVEPALGAGFYVGEDVFASVHPELLRSGFWLSDLRVCGPVRMRSESVGRLLAETSLPEGAAEVAIRKSPGWVEARYLRAPASLAESGAGTREYVLLWAFALLDLQPGFALDVAGAYERRFGQDRVSLHMVREAALQVRDGYRRAVWADLGRRPLRAGGFARRAAQPLLDWLSAVRGAVAQPGGPARLSR